ncbi:MAG TPA: tetratricopeptide repeat-containing protein, partial [Ktedonobacteraceae bacterium]|nr:tetratricopeptide repeat-containing protein [Ktedonobacteraceae bacterium]
YLKEQALCTEAEPFYQRALAIREEVLGPEHLDTAQSLYNLARLYYDEGRYAEGERLYLRVLAIREKRSGANHADIAQCLNSLALLYWAWGKHAEAEPVRSVHAKPWPHGGCVARQTILITPFLRLGAIPNLRNGPQTAVLPTVASGLQSVKRGTWEHPCKSDAGRQLVG